MKIKLQKFIADSGHCSRRKAEGLIEQNKVKVDGKTAKIGMRVSTENTVIIDGKKIKPPEKLIYIALNKPTNYTCTNKKNAGEKIVFDLVNIEERLFVVGRLDKDSRGLVLLTNDGDLTYQLTHPSFEHEKEYEVALDKELEDSIKTYLKEGVDIGEKTKARIKKIQKIGNKKYRVVLGEGKRRQIRRMFGAFTYTVLDLKRTRIDKYKLGNLKEGEWTFIEK